MTFLRYALPVAGLGLAAFQWACGKNKIETSQEDLPRCTSAQNPYRVHDLFSESIPQQFFFTYYPSKKEPLLGMNLQTIPQEIDPNKMKVYKGVCPDSSETKKVTYWNPTLNRITNVSSTEARGIALTDQSENPLYVSCQNGVYYFLGVNHPVYYFLPWGEEVKQVIKDSPAWSREIGPNASIKPASFPLIVNDKPYLSFMAVSTEAARWILSFGIVQNDTPSTQAAPQFKPRWFTQITSADGVRGGEVNHKISILSDQYLMFTYAETIMGDHPFLFFAIPIQTDFKSGIERRKTPLVSTYTGKEDPTTIENFKYSQIQKGIFSRYSDPILIHGSKGDEFWFLQNIEIDPIFLPNDEREKISRQPGVSTIHRYDPSMNYLGQIDLPVHAATFFQTDNKSEVLIVGLQNLQKKEGDQKTVHGSLVIGVLNFEGKYSVLLNNDSERYSVYPDDSFPVFSPARANELSSFSFNVSSFIDDYKIFTYDPENKSLSFTRHAPWRFKDSEIFRRLSYDLRESCQSTTLSSVRDTFSDLLSSDFLNAKSSECKASICGIRGLNEYFVANQARTFRYLLPSINQMIYPDGENNPILIPNLQMNSPSESWGAKQNRLNDLIYKGDACLVIENDLICFDIKH